MERIKILVDSGADIPKELVEKYDITVLPICIIINGEVFYDGVNLDGREYLEKITEYEQIPTTSMVPVEMMKDAFIKYSKEYDKLIYVTISSKSSPFSISNEILSIIRALSGPTDRVSTTKTLRFSCSLIYSSAAILAEL